MKRILPLIAAGLLSAPALHAEILLNEPFAYSPGSLASQGTWVASGTAGSNPINVKEDNLTFAGYQDEASGNCAVVDMSMGKNALQSIFAAKDAEAVKTAVYYSALVRVDAFPSSLGKPGAIMALTGVNACDGSYGDAQTGSEGGGLYVKKGTADGTAVFGVSRQSSPNGIAAGDVAWAATEVAVGETALIVVRYEPVEGADNDVVSLWVNPAATGGAADVAEAGGSESLADVRGLELCQRSALTSKIPQCTIDEVRVATEWDEIFTGAGAPVVVPNVTLSENPVDFGQVYCNVAARRTVLVKATDLEGDITLTLGESGQVAVSATTIAKEAAMSEEGYELTVTLTPVESRFFSDKITISTPGMGDKVLAVQWHPVPSLVASTLSAFCDEDNNDMTSIYVYTGQATVTFVETYYDAVYERMVNSIFAQDATGGVELRSAGGCGYEEVDISNVKPGDNLTNIVGYLIFGDDGLTMVPREADSWEVASEGNEVEPIELTLHDMAMAANGYVYGNQLVRVKHATFPDEYYEAGDYYGLWNSQKYRIFDGTLDDYGDNLAWMWCNKGADYYKTSTEGYFDHVWTLTGIANSYYPIHISPRSKADFEDEGVKQSGITDAESDAEATVTATYDLTGRRAGADARGVLIEHLSDGTARKVVR